MQASSTLVIGVAGGSGSGKTTFGRLLQSTLGDERSAILAQDSYYRDLHELFDGDGGQINFDHPESIEFDLLAEHIRSLKSGNSIEVPSYDFASHSRRPGRTLFQPKPIVIVDGILILSQEELRPLLDFTFFIDTEEQLRFERRLHRDVRERGRTAEGVHQQFFRQVKPMHDLFVEPSRRFADRVISGASSFAPVLQESWLTSLLFSDADRKSDIHLHRDLRHLSEIVVEVPESSRTLSS